MAQEIDLGNVVGPQGPKGDTGPQGPQGPKGEDGKTPSFEVRADGHLYAIWK